MAQSIPPGDIQTMPNAKIVFNAPYDDKRTYFIKVSHTFFSLFFCLLFL